MKERQGTVAFVEERQVRVTEVGVLTKRSTFLYLSFNDSNPLERMLLRWKLSPAVEELDASVEFRDVTRVKNAAHKG